MAGSVALGAVEHLADLRRELDAGRAAADDGDVQDRIIDRRVRHLRPQPIVEGFGLVQIVDEVAVFGHALGAEIVGPAADGEDQGVVVEAARRELGIAVGEQQRRQVEPAALPIQPVQAARPVVEMVPAGLGDEAHLFVVRVRTAGGEGVQHRLPDVRRTAVDEQDLRPPEAAEPVAALGRQQHPGNAAADDQDA